MIQLRQDDVPIVDATGQTLPLEITIYDKLEIGISAHSFGDDSALLYVDDIQIRAAEPE